MLLVNSVVEPEPLLLQPIFFWSEPRAGAPAAPFRQAKNKSLVLVSTGVSDPGFFSGSG